MLLRIIRTAAVMMIVLTVFSIRPARVSVRFTYSTPPLSALPILSFERMISFLKMRMNTNEMTMIARTRRPLVTSHLYTCSRYC